MKGAFIYVSCRAPAKSPSPPEMPEIPDESAPTQQVLWMKGTFIHLGWMKVPFIHNHKGSRPTLIESPALQPKP